MRHPESRLRPRNQGSAAMFGCAAARWGAEALTELGCALTRVAPGASRRVRPEDPQPGGFCKLCPHKAALPAPFDTTRKVHFSYPFTVGGPGRQAPQPALRWWPPMPAPTPAQRIARWTPFANSPGRSALAGQGRNGAGSSWDQGRRLPTGCCHFICGLRRERCTLKYVASPL